MCSYCGSRLDLDLRGWAHLQAAGESEPLQCPDCRSPLERLRLDGPTPVKLSRCPDCLGLFLPLGSLEQLLDQAVGPAWGVDHTLLQRLAETPRSTPAPVRYRPCPRCGDLMNRSLHGKRSGVVVDRCRDHGLWLDAGELRALLEWTRAGGVLHDRQRRQEERQEEVERLLCGDPRESSWWQQAAQEDLGTLLLRLARQLL